LDAKHQSKPTGKVQTMGLYEQLSEGSDAHRAEKGIDSLTIAVIDDSLASLERFQPVARAAIQGQHEGGYKIIFEHQSSRHLSGNLYDKLVLKRL
jgi:hypothetical protein